MTSISRRRFLGLLGSAPLAALACASGSGGASVGSGGVSVPAEGGAAVRDVHSGLVPTRVARILKPTTPAEVQRAVRAARDAGRPIAVSGARHAMGGQEFLTDGWLLDMRGVNGVRPLDFDAERGLLTVEAGAEWPDVFDFLRTTWAEDGQGWGIVQKQTGADTMTIGGSLAANVHGMNLGHPPFAADVERFVLIDPDGLPTGISREENGNLFRLAIGGYGLFGPVTEVTLRLRKRVLTSKLVSEETVEDAVPKLRDRAVTGDLYGEFEMSIDPGSYIDYLRRGILTTYRRVDFGVEIPSGQTEWTEVDDEMYLEAAHTDPITAVRMRFDHLRATDGQILWSDELQRAPYRPGYHAALDEKTGQPPGSESITEVFLPGVHVPSFLTAARALLRSSTTPVIRAVVRQIEPDTETFLPWAKDRFACVSFELHVPHTEAGEDVAAATVRALIDEALEREGCFYLTYHRWATAEQLLRGYPRFRDFLRLKRVYDPRERFQSDWYRYWSELLRSS